MKLLRLSGPVLFFFAFTLCFFRPVGAHAEASIGDSAMTVAFSTLGGAVLGASTLPFYDEPGDHTKNVFYGAALGAVAGVLISAYAGVKEGPAYDEDAATKLRPASSLALNESPEFRLHAEATRSTLKPASFGGGAPLLWSSLTSLRF